MRKVDPNDEKLKERYAQSLSRGNSKKQAAMDAGVPEGRASDTAFKLSKMPDVQARVAELTGKAQRARINTSAISKEACLSKLWEEAHDGKNTAQARIRAIEVIGKYQGYIADNKQVYKLPSDISQCSDEELDFFVEALLTMMYGRDEAKKRAVKLRLSIEAGLVIEATNTSGPTNETGGSLQPASETKQRVYEGDESAEF